MKNVIAIAIVILVSANAMADEVSVCLKLSKAFVDGFNHDTDRHMDTYKTLQANVVKFCNKVAIDLVQEGEVEKAKKAVDAIDTFSMSSGERDLFILVKSITACASTDIRACSVAAFSLDVLIMALHGQKEAEGGRKNLIKLRRRLVVHGCTNGDEYSCYLFLGHKAYLGEARRTQ